jgi:hypothetical protein
MTKKKTKITFDDFKQLIRFISRNLNNSFIKLENKFKLKEKKYNIYIFGENTSYIPIVVSPLNANSIDDFSKYSSHVDQDYKILQKIFAYKSLENLNLKRSFKVFSREENRHIMADIIGYGYEMY